MIYAMAQTIHVSKKVGGIGLFVDAKDRNAKRFYLRYAFAELPASPLSLFLPMNAIEAIIANPVYFWNNLYTKAGLVYRHTAGHAKDNLVIIFVVTYSTDGTTCVFLSKLCSLVSTNLNSNFHFLCL